MDKDYARQQAEGIEKAEDKYVYFLLAVAAAAIAYAMERTTNATLSGTDLLLAIAIACWGGSFWAGCTNRHGRLTAALKHFSADGMMFVFEKEGEAKGLPTKEPEIRKPIEEIVADINQQAGEASLSATRGYNLQFFLLVMGAAFFVCWHVAGMVIRTMAS